MPRTLARRSVHQLPAAALLAIATSGLAFAGPSRALTATPAPDPVSEQVFAVGFGKIAEVYLDPVDFDRLGMDGLKGLAGIDSAVTVERASTTVRLYVSGALAAEYGIAGPTDAGGWAALTTRVIDRARLYSPALAKATPERLYQVVFDGVTADLDGYSRYTGVQRATNERAQREGYGGIGITLDIVNGRTLVHEVMPHSPADRAGLAEGDQLLAIDGELTGRVSNADLRERLRGPTGTLITLTTARDGGAPRKLLLRRERVVPNTVTYSLSGDVGIVKLDRFNATTASGLRGAVVAMRQSAGTALHGMVLDLRGNPGGLLDQAVAVADLFIRRGRIISTEGRNPESRQRFDANPDDVLEGLPLVVLVDGRSASSAEVVASALQDSGRAVVVGASSYGKGSVQTVTRLPNDGELFLTWSRIYTPAGYTLHRQGVQPTVCTSRAGQTDPEALLSDLREGRLRPAQIASWRSKAADDETALNSLRETCPWKEHEPELDLKVAKRLLAEPGLYQRAVAMAVVNTVAER
ncbi:S41 family peptidase [Azospirillum picis]|uniref:Carboxyl-terminal processing protease n=1 Tax=Azospirillum picis TaxID=488438 RepID=A0ABU0MIL0_9PROT|nr:S41 family peptidase [Azospirillum picis]MBP2299615.1 carboxyl-terminal processing protease [Azospirillum picis]MDQ0533258.1 carboxyl-terminal processing protease [Azospirillum picis]